MMMDVLVAIGWIFSDGFYFFWSPTESDRMLEVKVIVNKPGLFLLVSLSWGFVLV